MTRKQWVWIDVVMVAAMVGLVVTSLTMGGGSWSPIMVGFGTGLWVGELARDLIRLAHERRAQ